MILLIFILLFAGGYWVYIKFGGSILQKKKLSIQIEFMYISTIIIELCRSKYRKNSKNRYSITVEKDRGDFYTLLSKKKIMSFDKNHMGKILFKEKIFDDNEFLEEVNKEFERLFLELRVELLVEEVYKHILQSFDFYFKSKRNLLITDDLLEEKFFIYIKQFMELEGIVEDNKFNQVQKDEEYASVKEDAYWSYLIRNFGLMKLEYIKMGWLFVGLVVVREVYNIFKKMDWKMMYISSILVRKLLGLYQRLLNILLVGKLSLYEVGKEIKYNFKKGKISKINLRNTVFVLVIQEEVVPYLSMDTYMGDDWNAFFKIQKGEVEVHFNWSGESYVFDERHIGGYREETNFGGVIYDIRRMWKVASRKLEESKEVEKLEMEKLIREILNNMGRRGEVKSIIDRKIKERIYMKDISMNISLKVQREGNEEGGREYKGLIEEYLLWRGIQCRGYGEEKLVMLFLIKMVEKIVGVESKNKVYWGIRVYKYWERMSISGYVSNMIELWIFVGGMVMYNIGKIWKGMIYLCERVYERGKKGMGKIKLVNFIRFIYNKQKRGWRLFWYKIEAGGYIMYNYWKKYVLVPIIIQRLRRIHSKKEKDKEERDKVYYDEKGDLRNIEERKVGIESKRTINNLEDRTKDIELENITNYCRRRKWVTRTGKNYGIRGEYSVGVVCWDGENYIRANRNVGSKEISVDEVDKYGNKGVRRIKVSEELWNKVRNMKKGQFDEVMEEVKRVGKKWEKKLQGIKKDNKYCKRKSLGKYKKKV